MREKYQVVNKRLAGKLKKQIQHEVSIDYKRHENV